MGTAREQLASLLKQKRLAAGYDSQARFAKAIQLSRPVVVKAESPTQPVPSDAVLIVWANTTGADLEEFRELAKRARSGTPEWFMPYLSAEQEASHLRLWGPLVVPGLLQTTSYARALLSDRPRPAEQLTALVDARIGRQVVLGNVQVTAVIDHRVLAHCIGSPTIMAEECAHLAALVEDQLISLHVVPELGNVSLTAPFAIATRGTVSTISMAASSRDITSIAPDVIEENMNLFEVILGASLPLVQSVEFVRQMEEKWKER